MENSGLKLARKSVLITHKLKFLIVLVVIAIATAYQAPFGHAVVGMQSTGAGERESAIGRVAKVEGGVLYLIVNPCERGEEKQYVTFRAPYTRRKVKRKCPDGRTLELEYIKKL